MILFAGCGRPSILVGVGTGYLVGPAGGCFYAHGKFGGLTGSGWDQGANRELGTKVDACGVVLCADCCRPMKHPKVSPANPSRVQFLSRLKNRQIDVPLKYFLDRGYMSLDYLNAFFTVF